MRVISLGSGSSGNALVVCAGSATVLVDAGFPARTLINRMRQVGVPAHSLNAICLTHEHFDHARGAVDLARRFGIPLVSDARTLDAVCAQGPGMSGDAAAVPREELPIGRATRFGSLEVRTFAVSHDAVAPCGFLLSSSAWCVFVATDTGMPTEPMVEALREAHLVVLEANHDLKRLLNGPYPYYLKQRIQSPTGHLSNAQACHALERALDDGPRWLWLAHLSKTNNTPDLARTHVREHLHTLGLRHIEPVPLPHELGPTWDSAELWGGTAPPATPATARVPSRAVVISSMPKKGELATRLGAISPDDVTRGVAARMSSPSRSPS